MRGLTLVRSVPLPLTEPSDCGSSSVCNLMRRHPIHLFRPASGDRGSALVYPVNGIQSDRWLRRIRSYQLCSNDRRHWCSDATSHPPRDDAPSHRRGWRGVLSFSFQAHACQGRVTLPYDFLWGVRAPNTRSPLRSVPPDYSISIIQSNFPLALHIVGVKTTSVCLATNGKPFICYSTSPGPGISHPFQ